MNMGIGLPKGVLHQNGIDDIQVGYCRNKQQDWAEPVGLTEACRQARGRTRRCGRREDISTLGGVLSSSTTPASQTRGEILS